MPARLVRLLAWRFVMALVLVVAVSSGAFLVTGLAPGDFTSELLGAPRDHVSLERERVGLDRPVIERYAGWLSGLARLDLGTSFLYGRPVRELVVERFANTALLGLTALVLASVVGIPSGVLTGSRKGVVAAAIRAFSALGVSMPPLLTALSFALLATRTGWFPVGGMTTAGADPAGLLAKVGDLAWHLVLPVVALGIPVAATLERLQSDAMMQALAQPCLQAARARGVPRGRLIWQHAFRVAARPVASLFGIITGSLLSGSFAVEVVTAWPGLGRLTYEALVSRDVHLVAGCAAAGSIILAIGALVSDLALASLDPRVGKART